MTGSYIINVTWFAHLDSRGKGKNIGSLADKVATQSTGSKNDSIWKIAKTRTDLVASYNRFNGSAKGRYTSKHSSSTSLQVGIPNQIAVERNASSSLRNFFAYFASLKKANKDKLKDVVLYQEEIVSANKCLLKAGK